MNKNPRLSFVETLKNELHSAKRVFHDYYIPHLGNNHHPKILHRHSVKALAVSLLALKILVVSVLFAVIPNGAYLTPEVEQQMVVLTNDYRKSLGDQLLVRNAYLDQVAKVRAQDMVDRNYFSHFTPDGKKPWEWIDSNQYKYERFGENLAMDFVTAKAVFDAFRASPSHDKNMRNAKYRDIGVAVVSGTIDGQDTNVMVVFYGSTAVPAPIPIVTTTPTPKPAPVTTPVPAVKPAPVIPKPVVPVVKPDTRTLPPSVPVSVAQPPVAEQPLALNAPQVAGLEEVNVAKTIVVPSDNSWVKTLADWSHNIYFLLLIAFIVITLVNIFVNHKVQHGSAILASLFLVVLIGYLWLADWHRLETYPSAVTVLGWFF